MTQSAYSLFEFYFRFINYLDQKFEQHLDEFTVKSFDLDGIDFLWQIVLNASDNDVGEKAIVTLARLQKNFASHLQGGILESRHRFLSQCLRALQEAASVMQQSEANSPTHLHASQQAHRAISLLNKFIQYLEVNLSKLTHGTSAVNKGSTMKLNLKPMTGEPHLIEVFENDTVGELRAKAADILKHIPKMLRLICMRPLLFFAHHC